MVYPIQFLTLSVNVVQVLLTGNWVALVDWEVRKAKEERITSLSEKENTS